MSLDVYLNIEDEVLKKGTGIFIRENGANKELTLEEAKEKFPDFEAEEYMTESREAYHGNITHNLGQMAEEAGIYKHLWRPEELNITKAKELIDPLREGLHRLKMDPERFKKFSPDNGWGTYDGLIKFVTNYLDACYEYPESTVETWR
jgi:hypothetical protein